MVKELSEEQFKREKVFWCLAGVFWSAMALLNVIGITKFVSIFGLSVAVGVLPYPVTFLCTDLISELFGKKRANFVVGMGLFINVFVLFCLWLGQVLPEVSMESMPPWQRLNLSESVMMPNGSQMNGEVTLYSFIYFCTSGAVAASMLAYVAAQFVDVHVFHLVRVKTKGKHLWLRNNVSTLVSQFVDSLAVVGVTFGAVFWTGGMSVKTLAYLFFSNYAFKALVALLDTPLFYFFTNRLQKITGIQSHSAGVD
jgi:hypothetical protein